MTSRVVSTKSAEREEPDRDEWRTKTNQSTNQPTNQPASQPASQPTNQQPNQTIPTNQSTKNNNLSHPSKQTDWVGSLSYVVGVGVCCREKKKMAVVRCLVQAVIAVICSTVTAAREQHVRVSDALGSCANAKKKKKKKNETIERTTTSSCSWV